MGPYVYREARQLNGKEKLGDGQCVTLIRSLTDAGWTGRWRQGIAVIGHKDIAPGTAIANFERGRWPGKRQGNHAAFYLGQVSDGLYMIDQWPAKKTISIRFVRRKGRDLKGRFINPSDNADAFYVIE